jgi:nucleoid DNA-binding protein
MSKEQLEETRKQMFEEIQAQLQMNQQIIMENSTGFKERVKKQKTYFTI